uniref:Putative tick metalloprotease n=1 Tax=Ixodes ricinus TaxID=34613 RepID=V5GG38_IXORI
MLLIFKCAYFSGLLLSAVDSAPFPEYVVYPRLLEARGPNGEKLLYIQDDIILRLERSSVLADNLIFRETIDGTTVDKFMDGKKLGANMYHDRNQMASVAKEDENGTVEVKGIMNGKLRIAPLNITARSEDGRIPHKIFQVTSRFDKENNNKAGPGVKTNGSIFLAELKILVDKEYRETFKTEDDLAVYLGLCMVLVNFRYEDTTEPTVQFLLTTVEVALDDIFYVFYGYDVDCRSCSQKKYLNPSGTLDWMAALYGRGPEDIVVLVTSMDMADRPFGVIKNHVMGLAISNGFCSVRERVAVVEDQPHTYSFIQLIAHELAHTTLGQECIKIKSAQKPAMPDTAVLPGTNLNMVSYCEHKHPSFCNISVRQDNIKQCKFECCPGGRVKCFHKRPGDTKSCSEAQDINSGINRKFNCCLAGNFKCFEETAVDGMSCGDGMMCFRNKCVKQCDPFKERGSFTLPGDD